MISLFYVSDNVEQLDTSSNDVIEIESPLFENKKFDKKLPNHNIYDVWDLVSRYSMYGERAYFSVEIDESRLVRVIDTIISIDNEKTKIECQFEDGRKYNTALSIDNWSNEEIDTLLEIIKETSKHIYLVRGDLIANQMSFYSEQWG